MYVHGMNHSETTPNGLPIRAAAALVGAREVDVRHAIAAGEIPTRTIMTVDPDDVRSWQAKADQR